jgi:hypothetical protein
MTKEKINEETTNNKLNKSFINSLYVPSYKPSIYGSKIKENYTVQIKSFSFESVDTDKSRKNIMSKTGNMPSIPSMEELQKQGQTAYNLIINGSLSTESHTEFNEVDRFVISLNNLKALSNFDSINNCLNTSTNVYEIESISIDNRLKRVTFNPIIK